MAKKKMKDLDPKSRAKNVKGGSSVWNDNKNRVPGLGKIGDKVVFDNLRNTGKKLSKGQP